MAMAAKHLPMHSQAESWIIYDGVSGVVMDEQRSNVRINPGDLVQLMTLYTALDLARKAKIDLNQPVSITPEDSLRLKSGRLLYLVSGETAPLYTLLQGVAVVSAEDAVLAVTTHLAGTMSEFVERMNQTARSLGMNDSRFTSAISDKDQVTTAADLAKLAAAFHADFSKEFRWFAERNFSFNGLTLKNRNLILWRGDDIGGVMTNSSNTNIIASWHRQEKGGIMPRHIFAVLLGGKDSDTSVNDVLTLLKSGRQDYQTVHLFDAMTTVKRVEILTGNREKLEVGSSKDVWVTVKRKDISLRGTGGFSARFEYLAPAVAPVKTGDVIGKLRIFFENQHLADFDMVALHDVGMGSFLSRFVDSVRLRMKPVQKMSQTVDEKSN